MRSRQIRYSLDYSCRLSAKEVIGENLSFGENVLPMKTSSYNGLKHRRIEPEIKKL